MKYTVKPTSKFQKDLKRAQKRGYDIGLLTEIIKKLANGEVLPPRNRDHNLSGNYSNCRECHITPEWLLIYEIYEDDLSVVKEIKEIMALYGIIDIKQRMLKIPELKKIMGFPENYVLIGTQADQKKFIGNAVEVNMARVLCEALCKKLKELELSPLTLKFSA